MLSGQSGNDQATPQRTNFKKSGYAIERSHDTGVPTVGHLTYHRGVFHPWRVLKQLAHVRLSWVVMPDRAPGRTNGVDVIWMDKRLDQVERRCTLTHELIHIERNHTGCQRASVELEVSFETARRLIPIEDLANALRWSNRAYELADELWVTHNVLADRLQSLTPHEIQILAATEAQRH